MSAELGFHFFAGNVAVSHAYAQILDFEVGAQIGGIVVHSGGLLHGDQHGLPTIPAEIASHVPAAAEQQRKNAKR